MPSYKYYPIHGVEPFVGSENGPRGAKVTQENLVITAWRIPVLEPTIVWDQILIPESEVSAAENPNVKNIRLGYRPSMRSRYAARLTVETTDDPNFGTVGLVLNPPLELRQQMSFAAEFLGGDPLSPTSYKLLKSIMDDFVWHFLISKGFSGRYGGLFPTLLYSSYVPFEEGWPYPYLRTNGADGEEPKFFDTTASGVKEMIAHINGGGDFFIFVAIRIADNGSMFNTSPGAAIDIRWPHSIARA